MRIVHLSAPQIVSLFGWNFRIKPFLSWEDVQNTPGMTFRSLRRLGLSPIQLHTLQPDAAAWRQHGTLTLHDCTDMTLWPVHPIRNLRADLADIISMHWTPEQMKQLGVTVDDLMHVGMTADIMCMISYPLSAWLRLGLTKLHVDTLTENEIQRVFHLSHEQLQTVMCTACTSENRGGQPCATEPRGRTGVAALPKGTHSVMPAPPNVVVNHALLNPVVARV